MCPEEVWMFIDARTPEKTYGALTETEVAKLAALHEKINDAG